MPGYLAFIIVSIIVLLGIVTYAAYYTGIIFPEHDDDNLSDDYDEYDDDDDNEEYDRFLTDPERAVEINPHLELSFEVFPLDGYAVMTYQEAVNRLRLFAPRLLSDDWFDTTYRAFSGWVVEQYEKLASWEVDFAA
jgi:hypothetical protein